MYPDIQVNSPSISLSYISHEKYTLLFTEMLYFT
jgi:hypothetical protein